MVKEVEGEEKSLLLLVVPRGCPVCSRFLLPHHHVLISNDNSIVFKAIYFQNSNYLDFLMHLQKKRWISCKRRKSYSRCPVTMDKAHVQRGDSE